LNVGCCWLWQVKNHLSFDEGSRVENFSEFESEDQFSSVSDQLAKRAAQEVTRYRGLFPDVTAVAHHYVQKNPADFWSSYNAAVALALSGNSHAAHRFFAAVVATDRDPEWAVAAAAGAKELHSIAADTGHLRTVVEARVHRTRELLKLPPVAVRFDGVAFMP
jgi:hypothetical protein